MFRRFGSRVTIVQRAAQLLEREDLDLAEEVAKIMREDGIEVGHRGCGEPADTGSRDSRN